MQTILYRNNNLLNKLKIAIFSIFSGEVFFALFILAGIYKSVIPLQNYIDLTLLFLILSGISVITRIYLKPTLPKGALPALLAFAFLCGIIMISLMYSPSQFALAKTINIVILVGWSFVAPFFLFRSDESIKRLLTVIVIFSIIMGFDAFAKYIIGEYNNGFVAGFETNYLWFARVLSVAAIILLTKYLLDPNKMRIKNVLYFILILFLLFMIIISGARGPILQLAFVIVLLPAFSIEIRKRLRFKKTLAKSISLVFLVLFLFSTYLYYQGYFEIWLSRMDIALNSSNDEGRYTLAEDAFNIWKANPMVGIGVNGFYLTAYDVDQIESPHNIPLELMSEQGLLGLAPFLFLIYLSLNGGFSAYKRLSGSYRQDLQLTLLLTLIYLLLLIVFSSLDAARIMFTFMAISIISPYRNEHATKIMR